MKYNLLLLPILFLCINTYAINPSTLKHDVTFLASDELEGRLSATKGDTKAINWIVTQFKQAGLKPGNGESYLQDVPLIQYTSDKKQTYIALHRGHEIIKWKEPHVFTNFYQDFTVRTNVVFAGYGITAPALHYDDYQNIDVNGKIVMVFEHEPQEENATSIFNGKANTRFATTRVKVLNAQAHGALAVLIAPEPNRKHPSNQQRYQNIGNEQEPPSQVLQDDVIHIPYAVISDDVAKKIAGNDTLSTLQTLIDKQLKPQSKTLPNTQVSFHEVNKTASKVMTQNVVGLLEGRDPSLKVETILISAHHDHDGISGGKIWHGADDNASGTAGVIALAREFAAKKIIPKRSILFVVFAAEERGLLGAYYMTEHPLRSLDTTRAVLNFDMIGRNETDSKQTHGLIDMPADTSNRLNLIGGHYSPDYLKVVTEQNRQIGLVLDNRFDNEAALNVFFRSDQFPFVLKNIPAFWWFTGFHDDYHHPSDTAEKINYNKMAKILNLAYLSANVFANASEVPTFIENPMSPS